MRFTKSRSEKVADKAHDILDTVKGKLEDSEALNQVKDTVSEKASDLRDAAHDVDTDGLKDSAKSKASTGRARFAAFTAPAAEKVADTVDRSDSLSTARDKTAEAAGITRDQATSLFNDEWMPRIQQALAAATAGTTAAVHKLPEPAQEQVAKAAPDLVKQKKRGGFLILLGLAGLAGAGYLYYQGQQKKQAQQVTTATPSQTAAGTTQAKVDDLVGDTEAKAQSTLRD